MNIVYYYFSLLNRDSFLSSCIYQIHQMSLHPQILYEYLKKSNRAKNKHQSSRQSLLEQFMEFRYYHQCEFESLYHQVYHLLSLCQSNLSYLFVIVVSTRLMAHYLLLVLEAPKLSSLFVVQKQENYFSNHLLSILLLWMLFDCQKQQSKMQKQQINLQVRWQWFLKK